MYIFFTFFIKEIQYLKLLNKIFDFARKYFQLTN